MSLGAQKLQVLALKLGEHSISHPCGSSPCSLVRLLIQITSPGLRFWPGTAQGTGDPGARDSALPRAAAPREEMYPVNRIRHPDRAGGPGEEHTGLQQACCSPVSSTDITSDFLCSRQRLCWEKEAAFLSSWGKINKATRILLCPSNIKHCEQCAGREFYLFDSSNEVNIASSIPATEKCIERQHCPVRAFSSRPLCKQAGP